MSVHPKLKSECGEKAYEVRKVLDLGIVASADKEQFSKGGVRTDLYYSKRYDRHHKFEQTRIVVSTNSYNIDFCVARWSVDEGGLVK